MTFDSIEDIKKYILSKSGIAIQKGQEQVYSVISDFLFEYYNEFDPDVYVRTYQLLCSFVKGDVVQTANGWEAYVYFDLDSLDYSIKTLRGVGTWENTFHRDGWTHENDIEVFKMAAHGSHGGWENGTAVWDEPIAFLKTKAYDILKKALIDSGVPIK